MTPRRPRWTALVLASATAAAGPPAARPPASVVPPEIRQWLDLPVLPPATVADVARLVRRGDRLAVLTRQPPTDGAHRIAVAELPGFCTLTILPLHLPGQLLVPPATGPSTRPAEPTNMLLEWARYDRPGTTDEATTVMVLPANVQLVRVTEWADDADVQVQLTEQPWTGPTRPGGPPAVRLQVMFHGPTGRARPAPATAPAPRPANVDVSAGSFAALCRLSPGPVARYLEPILRDLRADDALLPPDATLAYQAFADDVPVDPATAVAVGKLVAQLDADDYAVRDAAGDRLRDMGPVAAVAVGRIDPATLSPEQRSRTAAVVRQARPVSDADARRLAGDPAFLLNCLKVDDPFVTATVLARLRTRVGHDVPFDGSLHGHARLEAVWRLRQQVDPAPAEHPATDGPNRPR